MGRSTLLLAVAALLAAGCTSEAIDDVAIFGDLARSADLAATAHDLAVTPDFAVVPDLAQRPDLIGALDLAVLPTCAPSGGCANGPLCGKSCCNTGERCDPGTGTCLCAMGAACALNQICATGGPVMRNNPNPCGIVCCGDVNHPCPL